MAQQEIAPANDEIIELKKLRGGWQGVLEHLDVPSNWIDAIEKRRQEIFFCLLLTVAAVVVVTGWSVWSQFSSRKAAVALTEAMNASDESRSEQLTRVVEAYGSTTTTQWALVELAHLAAKKNDFAQAASLYQKALAAADSSSPAVPLIRLGLAGTYEKKEALENALEQYTLLSQTSGFVMEGLLGMARIAEQKGDGAAARVAYEKFLAAASQASLSGGNSAQLKEFVEQKLAGLKE